MKFLIIAAAILFAVAPLPAQAPAVNPAPAAGGSRPDSLALARQYIKWLYTGRADSLYAHTAEPTRKSLGSAERYREITGNLLTSLGSETEVESEKFVMRSGKPQYWRVARFSLLQEDFLLRLVIVDGEIAGLGFDEAWDAPPVDQPKR